MKNVTKYGLRRWIALIMCAVVIAGMAPEALTQGAAKVYAEPEKPGATVTIDPGDWFPEALSAGTTIGVNDDYNFSADDESVTGYFMGFYFDRNWDYRADTVEVEETRYYDFRNNQSYYAFFRVYGGYDEDDEPIAFGGTVKIGSTVLDKFSDDVYYLKMTIGTPVKHRLTLLIGDKAELPEAVKGGVEFEEGETIIGLLGYEQASELDYIISDDGKYIIDGWTYGDSTWRELSGSDAGYVLHNADSDIEITAVWRERTAASAADITIGTDLAGLTKTNIESAKFLEGYSGGIYYYLAGFYSDSDLKEKINEDAVLKAGTKYYAKIWTDPDGKYYYFDEKSLPKVSVNGKDMELKLQTESADGDPVRWYYFVWEVTPTEYIPQFYDIVLDYNYPDGTEDTHTITDIPAGTDIDGEGFSIIQALRYKATEGGGITYEAYLELLEEYNTDSDAFGYVHEYCTAEAGDGFYCLDTIRTKPSFATFEEYDKDTIDTRIKADMTLYLQWCIELKSVKLENIEAPVCGQTETDYPEPKLTFEKGIISNYPTKFSASNNMVESLSENTIFKGGNEYTVVIREIAYKGGEDSKDFFDDYISERTAIVYNGKEYNADEYGDYFIPVTAIHDMPEDAATVRENEVPATCETPGSYDEVLRYECSYCHEGIEKIEHKTIPAPGHDWGEWKVVKEATETEEGIEERVCKRDPDHKETRKIPKKQKQTDPSDPANPDQPDNPVNPEQPKPDTQTEIVVSVNKTEKINNADVSIETVISYPKAVTWTGSKITKAQLAALSKDGVIASIKISGLDKAIAGLNKDADLSKLFKVSYVIGKEKNVNTRGSFYVKLKLDSKVLKKAKIKGTDKKALSQIVKDLNKQFKDNPYYFNIVPVELKDAESVTIKAKLKNGELQLNDDGSIKGFKNLKIKVNVPGLKKAKTYTFSAKKAVKSFTIKVTDVKNKKADVTALSGQNFTGSRSGADITK